MTSVEHRLKCALTLEGHTLSPASWLYSGRCSSGPQCDPETKSWGTGSQDASVRRCLSQSAGVLWLLPGERLWRQPALGEGSGLQGPGHSPSVACVEAPEGRGHCRGSLSFRSMKVSCPSPYVHQGCSTEPAAGPPVLGLLIACPPRASAWQVSASHVHLLTSFPTEILFMLGQREFARRPPGCRR